MILSAAEAAAEAWGFMARQTGVARESNPYEAHLQVSPFAFALAEAWWRGWDLADSMLPGEPKP